MVCWIPKVKCYGGPLHGEHVRVDPRRFGGRFEVAVEDRLPMVLRPECKYVHFEPLRTVSYVVETYCEQQGNACREMQIAIIEGAKNFLAHEEWEIGSDISVYHWSPVRKPSFLRDFDSWFAWCAYRHTNHDLRYIREEFRR